MKLLQHAPNPGAWEISNTGRIIPVRGHVSFTMHPFVNMLSRWDAGWYGGIARDGYKFTVGQQSNTAFFPMYPMLIRAVHSVVRSSRLYSWFLCGIVVSNAALLAALAYFFQLVRLEFDGEAARRAVLYFLIFPTTLFLSAVYSEAVFLSFLIGSFYHARKGQWGLAGLLGCAATLSRPPGCVVIVGLIAEYLMQIEFNWRRIRLNVFALGLVPLGLGAFLLYLRYAQGSVTAAAQAQYAWGLKLQNPWTTASALLQRAPDGGGTMIDFGFTLVALGLVTAVAFRLRASYAAFSIAYLAFITMWGSLESIPRYILGLFPIVVLLALFGRNDAFHRVYVPFSAALAALFMAIFAVWGWVA